MPAGYVPFGSYLAPFGICWSFLRKCHCFILFPKYLSRYACMEAGRWPLCLALLERMRQEKARP